MALLKSFLLSHHIGPTVAKLRGFDVANAANSRLLLVSALVEPPTAHHTENLTGLGSGC